MTKARDIATSEVVSGEIGDTIQAHDDDLDSIAALDKTDGNVIVGDGTDWVAESGATARTSLGLGTAATTASSDYATAAQGALADSAVQTETDPVVGAITGIVKADGAGSISAATAGTDYLTPTGDGSSLTGIAGGFSNMQVFTSPGTWTNPGNVQKVKVTVVGGGGGGGASFPSGNTPGGGGGGGGGSATEVISFPSGTNVPVSVGNGAAGATSWNVTAGSGGTSSFGSYCSATGGGGGGASPTAGAGGTGGNGSGGNLNISGASGYPGTPSSDPWIGGGSGGNTIFGGGGAGKLNGNVKAGSARSGAGGGGGSRTAGGAGGSGVVIVEY